MRRTQLARNTPFSFACRQCLHCCHGKDIQINPYEVARLARNLGLTTTDFIDRFTAAGGTLLAWGEDSACIFLDSRGCTVHPDRPLVCRLYPLGRHVGAAGEERFSELEPHPACVGIYGEEGDITGYLGAQEVAPYLEAADRYLRLFWTLLEIMDKNAAEPLVRAAMLDTYQNFSHAGEVGTDRRMDMDPAVSAYCRENDLAFPDDVEEKMLLHVQAIEAWQQIMKGDNDEKAG